MSTPPQLMRQIDQWFIENQDIQYLLLLGGHQTGKTTLIKRIFPQAFYLSASDEASLTILNTCDTNVYHLVCPTHFKTIIIDDAHKLSEPDKIAELLIQKFSVSVILISSLTYYFRKKDISKLRHLKVLFPLTFSEYLEQIQLTHEYIPSITNRILKASNNQIDMESQPFSFEVEPIIQKIIVYGLLPDHMGFFKNPPLHLAQIIEQTIDDLYQSRLIDSQDLAKKILIKLATQVGQLINCASLSREMNCDQRTINRYIEIFEEHFIIFRLFPFSTSRNEEICKSYKVYFYDNGIRNGLINSFSEIKYRIDKDILLENFIIAEFVKENYYLNTGYYFGFWRTKQSAEIEIVLFNENRLIGIKINNLTKQKNKSFLSHYPYAELFQVNYPFTWK